MKIVVCMYGELQYIDLFMIESFVKRILYPIQSRVPNATFVKYFHSFLTAGIFKTCMNMHNLIDFDDILIQKDPLISIGPSEKKTNRLHDLSSRKIISMIEEDRHPHIDLIIMTRLDLLFTRDLGQIDIDAICSQYTLDKIFIPDTHSAPENCFMIGKPEMIKLCISKPHIKPEYFLSNLHIFRLSLVMVRIQKDMSVHPDDKVFCPYIQDLIISSKSSILLHLSEDKSETQSFSEKYSEQIPLFSEILHQYYSRT